jgi:ELWxxDGT repeat protein
LSITHALRTFYTFLLILITLGLHGQIRFEADFNTSETGSAPSWITPFDGRVFFSATDGYTGREAWIYDPAISQAYRLKDIHPAAGNANPREVTVVNDVLYFVADSVGEQQLWRLLPNENRVEKVMTDSIFREIKSLTIYAGDLYFRAIYQGEANGEVYLHRYLLAEGTDERVENTNDALALSVTSFAAMSVHQEQLYLVGRRLDSSLQTLITYDAVADSFAFVPNQLTDNDKPIWVTDFRSFGDYLIMNIRNPESLNDAYLGVYEAATDSITIEFEEALWTANPPRSSIEVAGDQLFFQKRGSPRTLLRTYDPVTGTVGMVSGVSDSEQLVQMETIDEELLIYTSISYADWRIHVYDPSTGALTNLPVEESFPDAFNGHTSRSLVRVGDNWYYRGGEEDNPELFRYQESDGTTTRLSDIHSGTGNGYPRFFQSGVDNQLYARVISESFPRANPHWIAYDPTTQLFETMLPELEWSFYSKLYQFPGYLMATLVEFEGVDYEAVAYDSTTQTYVPIIEAMPDCNGSFTRAGGTYIPYDGALYFTYCDGNRLQLFRHQFNVAGAEQISNLTDQSLHKGSFQDETIGQLGDDLIIPIGASFSSVFNNDLYRFDGDTLTEIDLEAFNIREPSVVQTPNAVYLSVTNADINTYFPAYLREGDPTLHLMTYQGDTIPRLFPLNFHLQDTTVYFIFENQVLRHTPASEAAELYYSLPDELNNAHSPYLFNGRLYFVATGAEFGAELYEVSDLNEGPLRVSDISSGRPGSMINSIKDNGGRLFFAADDGIRGSELWSYQPNCFTIDIVTETSNINWPTGSVTATPASGAAPFSYRWNTSDTTASLQDLAAGFYEVTITDANGCSTSQSAWVETNGLISSTEEEVASLSATVYPNPFRHTLNVQFNGVSTGVMTAELFSLNGQLIRTQNFPAHQDIALATDDLPAGLFVLRLRNEAGQVVLLRKVVKR